MSVLAQTTLDVAPQLGLLAILVSAAFTDNILLTRFLGMCSYLAVSRQMKAAVGLGVAVTFVTTITAAINAVLYHHVLVPLGLHTSLKLIVFIVVIAAFVQLLEMIVERVSLPLYYALGIFLPLITVNCAILGTSLFMVNSNYNVGQSLVFGFGSGVGWMLAIVLMAGIRERLKKAQIPPALEGPGISLIITGIMALAFVAFTGMIQQ
ncbi:NADH:ubiquinone reductase (Na(+)-transporting) subunit E [bacterium]|nr:NADH:ubiquinone reductase (Na(+)-transporting) subunit E [bacterium]